MRTVEVKLFQFDELSDSAKEKARDWYREASSSDFDPEFEPFETAAKILGITFNTNEYGVDIRYSGFCSQGDGASFVGSYDFARGCSKAIRTEFPMDEKLHAIADGLTALQAGYRLLHGRFLVARITQSGNYYHKYTMDVETDSEEQDSIDRDDIGPDSECCKQMTELMRDFAQWIYDGLESDYEYRNSDECVDDNIMANGYEFDEDGDRA